MRRSLSSSNLLDSGDGASRRGSADSDAVRIDSNDLVTVVDELRQQEERDCLPTLQTQPAVRFSTLSSSQAYLLSRLSAAGVEPGQLMPLYAVSSTKLPPADVLYPRRSAASQSCVSLLPVVPAGYELGAGMVDVASASQVSIGLNK